MTDTPTGPHIDVGSDLRLPVAETLTGRAFITGKSGSGKSNTASVVIEELLGEGHAVLIVDADGEYRGLKEKYEVLHVGAGEACDLQVGPEHSERLAQIALVQNVPVVLDVSEYLEEKEARSVVQKTANALYQKEASEQRPFLLVVEEVHEYLPEGPSLGEAGKTLIRIAKRGRKRGLGLMGISQRPADVKKSFITQCDWLVWHRLTWDNDTKVVRRVVGGQAEERVKTLGDGEAIVVSDWLEESPTVVQFRRKSTVDLGATPGLGEKKNVELKSISSDIVEDLKEITEKEKRRQDKVGRLKQKLKNAQDEIDALEEELDRARDMSDMAQQFTQALSSAGGEGGEALQKKVEEIREEKNDEIRSLRSQRDDLSEELRKANARIEELEEKASRADKLQHLNQHMPDAREAVRRLAEALGMDLGDESQLRNRIESQKQTIAQLKEQIQKGSSEPEEIITEAADFLENDAVRAAIEEAKEDAPPKYIKGVIATCLDVGEATYDDIAETLGHSSTSHVSEGVDPLEARKIVRVGKNGRRKVVSLNLEGLQEIRRSEQNRKRRQDVMDKL